jgi:hypothetical protein
MKHGRIPWGILRGSKDRNTEFFIWAANPWVSVRPAGGRLHKGLRVVEYGGP